MQQPGTARTESAELDSRMTGMDDRVGEVSPVRVLMGEGSKIVSVRYMR